MDNIPSITSWQELEELVVKIGILPFFRSKIENFSVEEFTPRYLWFDKFLEGPWEWKSPIASNGLVVYSKLFQGKAVYMRMDLYKELMNYRRNRYPLMKGSAEETILKEIIKKESLNTKEIKTLLPLNEKGKSLKSIISIYVTNLQMMCQIVPAVFEYNYTKDGQQYGWGIARYTTPEILFEDLVVTSHTPEESLAILQNHLKEQLPEISEKEIYKLLG